MRGCLFGSRTLIQALDRSTAPRPRAHAPTIASVFPDPPARAGHAAQGILLRRAPRTTPLAREPRLGSIAPQPPSRPNSMYRPRERPQIDWNRRTPTQTRECPCVAFSHPFSGTRQSARAHVPRSVLRAGPAARAPYQAQQLCRPKRTAVSEYPFPSLSPQQISP